MSVLKSRRLRHSIMVVLTGLLLLTAAGCGGEKPSGESSQPVTLRFASTLPVGHNITESCELFKTIVEERSRGRVKIEHYPAMQLYGDKDLVDVVPRGGVEIANISFGMWTGLVPEFGLFDILSLVDGTEHSYRIQDDPEVREIVGKSLREKGNAVLIGWPGMEARGPLTVNPVQKLEDWNGMKVRAHSEYNSYWFKAMGASPVVMSSAEVYQALQRKTIEGVYSGGTSFVQRKFIEVAKYAIDNPFLGYGAFALVVNKDAWDKLPGDIQEIMIQAGKEATAFNRVEAHKAEDAAWDQMARTPGFHITHLSDQEMERWRSVTLPYQREIFEQRAGKETSDRLFARVEALREKK